MVLFYDFEVRASEEEKEFVFSGKSGIILNVAKEFILQRIKPLEEEIEITEGYVMIVVHKERFKLELKPFKVSEELSNKIINSLSESDHLYLLNLIWAELYPGIIPPTN